MFPAQEQGMSVSFVENFPTMSARGMELGIWKISVWVEAGLPLQHLKAEIIQTNTLVIRGDWYDSPVLW